MVTNVLCRVRVIVVKVYEVSYVQFQLYACVGYIRGRTIFFHMFVV